MRRSATATATGPTSYSPRRSSSLSRKDCPQPTTTRTDQSASNGCARVGRRQTNSGNPATTERRSRSCTRVLPAARDDQSTTDEKMDVAAAHVVNGDDRRQQLQNVDDITQMSFVVSVRRERSDIGTSWRKEETDDHRCRSVPRPSRIPMPIDVKRRVMMTSTKSGNSGGGLSSPPSENDAASGFGDDRLKRVDSGVDINNVTY